MGLLDVNQHHLDSVLATPLVQRVLSNRLLEQEFLGLKWGHGCKDFATVPLAFRLEVPRY